MTEQAENWSERSAAFYHLTKTDPDPRVRRRTQALLLVEEGHSQASAARLLRTSAYRVHVMIQDVVSEEDWHGKMQPEDYRALTPLIYHHVNPYGRHELNMQRRLPLRAIA